MSETGQQPLHVRPYRHQVGGHHAIGVLRTPDFGPVIAKPIVDRERFFYEHLLDERLQEFVPRFLGERQVCFPRTTDVPSTSTDTTAFVPTLDGLQSSPPQAVKALNPWALRCLERADLPVDPIRCILLEDLTGQYRYPCVLDIKMGVRLHGVDVSTRKQERAKAKSSDTTSGALGLRICGLQVYDSAEGAYKCQDKYAGRALTADELPATLELFFIRNHGSLSSRRCQHVLEAIIAKLQRLEATISQLPGYRFFSSSLLLLYDGDPSVEQPKADIRMIDFAHTARLDNEQGAPAIAEEDLAAPDQGYVFGLRNLLRFLRVMLASASATTATAATAAAAEAAAEAETTTTSSSATATAVSATAVTA